MLFVMRPIQSQAVAAVFQSYPHPAREKLFSLREIIFDVATHTPGVGALEESLKWGEPAYITSATKSGSTIRIAWKPARHARRTHCAMYFNCQTTLVDSFKTMFPTTFTFEGNRALVFDAQGAVPVEALRICIEMALTYQSQKREKA